MHQPISRELEHLDVNLYQYPHLSTPHLNQTVTVGDMHGNSMKLLWILCYLGILEFAGGQKTWDRLWEIYKEPLCTRQFFIYLLHVT